ncbi:MAG: M23 family metallopeptidase, partial [Clostridia bacterium]|nr:M23 family metallopeptidase [Clostridia bacterium]
MEGFDETYPRKRTVNSKKKRQNAKPDWLVGISSAQLTLAVIGIALLLLISKASPADFNELRTRFNAIMSNDMSVSQVVNAVKNLIPDISPAEEETSLPSGGEDVALYEATENVCFAPIETTVDICLPVDGEFTSRFGYRTHPITGKFGIHNGLDIAAPEGTKISAAFNGIVEEVGCNNVR